MSLRPEYHLVAMVLKPRLTRRRLILFFAGFFLTLHTTYLLLPHDSHIRLSINFNTSRFWNAIRASTTDRDAWLRQSPAPHPLSLRDDVGYLIKTGYGTRHRLPALIEAFARTGDILGDEHQSFIVVGDWTPTNQTVDGLPTVYNAVDMLMETKLDPSLRDHPRLPKYRSLQEAIDSGDENQANELGREFGWELDALKVE